MSKTIYAVMYAYYSDWQLYGYFSDRLEAEKYCAAHPNMELHVEKLACMDGKEDLHNIELKYEHRVVFDRKNNTWEMREDPEGYKFYQSEYLRSNSLQICAGEFNGWIAVRVNTNKNDRKLAENIAQVNISEVLTEDENNRCRIASYFRPANSNDDYKMHFNQFIIWNYSQHYFLFKWFFYRQSLLSR